ncbi:MAG TPA: NADH-quinone oxidoreductase subunit D [Coriobacteriia bacterium]|nr:NADH-quinone oxidoreductase subunit D [Coriobacteriia bacterium]
MIEPRETPDDTVETAVDAVGMPDSAAAADDAAVAVTDPAAVEASLAGSVSVLDREGDRLVVNIGPSHPSTHGVCRVLVELDGEIITNAEPIIGHLHRGIEKMAENRTYLQVVPLTDRLDYVGSMYANWAYCRAVERLAGIRVPERAEYIRVIVCELQRIASHMMSIGSTGADTGATTAFMYSFWQREQVVDLFEQLCGARLTYNYVRPGGVSFDIPEGWVDRCRDFIAKHPDAMREIDRLLFGNVICRARTKGIGVLDPDDAVAWGVTGPTARGSGVDWDLRRDDPYSVYPRFDFDVPVGERGDCYDRGRVRLFECIESCRIIGQALDQLAELEPGVIKADGLPRLLAPRPGDAYDHIESARGSLGVYLVSDGSVRPYRMKVRSPAFSNLAILPMLAKGHTLSDLVVILGSLDPVFGEVDR